MRQLLLWGLLASATVLALTSTTDASTAGSSLMNLPPVANNDTITVNEGDTIYIDVLANDYDPEGGLLNTRYVEALGPQNGTASVLNEDQIIYIPDAGYTGPDPFQYFSCDSTSECSIAYVYVNVIPPNRPPEIDEDVLTNLTTDEDVALDILVLENTIDLDGDDLDIIILDDVSNGSTVISEDTIIYTPDMDYFGPDSLTYLVCDQEPICDTITTYIDVLPINDPPIAMDDFEEIPENQDATLVLFPNDDDIDNEEEDLTISILTPPTLGTATVNGVAIDFSPRKLEDGLDSLQYIICDLEPLCDTAWVRINITDECDDCLFVDEDESGDVFTYATNTDPAITFVNTYIFEAPLHGTTDINNDTITYSPFPNYNGEDKFTYIVCDTEPQCDTVKMCVYIKPVNDKPEAFDDKRNATEEIPRFIDAKLNDLDIDGDALTVTIIGSGSANIGEATVVDNELKFLPYFNKVGIDSVQYEACDAGGLCDTAWVEITVAEVPEIIRCIDEDSINYVVLPLVKVLDPISGDSIYENSISSIGTPSSGGTTVLRGDTSYLYTPPMDWFGEDTMLIEVCYPSTVCISDTIFITVKPVDDQLIAVNDFMVLPENDSTELNLYNNDINPDGGTVTFRIIDSPVNGSTDVQATTLKYIPNAEFIGMDSLTYEICTTPTNCDTATVYITVEFLNEKPVAPTDEIVSITDTTCIDFNPLLTATDPNGDTLIIEILGSRSSDVSIADDGTMTYCPDTDFLTTDTIYYAICDTHAMQLCDTAMLVLNMDCPAFNHMLSHDAVCPDVLFSVTGTEVRNLTEYEWSFTDQLGVITNDPTIIDFKLSTSKRLALRTQRFGCIPEYDSINIDIRSIVPPAALDNELLECENVGVTLSINSANTLLDYEWYYASTDALVGTGPDLVINELNTSTEGDYYVIANDGVCQSVQSSPLNLEIITDFTPPTINAGTDQTVCGEEIYLAAPVSSFVSEWTTSGAAYIAEPDNPTTEIFGAEIGENKFYWNQENQSCVENSIDSVSIFYYPLPDPVNDSFFVELNKDYTFDVKPNDNYFNLNTSITVLNTPSEVIDLGDGVFTVNIDGTDESPLDFEYEVCFDECPDKCKTTVVNVYFEEISVCQVPDVITPNGDGINDYLIVDCINEYPQSTMIIFNRWGDEVYNNEDYDNSWNAMEDGKPLAVGTYFYLFKINNTEESVETGFIHVDR